MPIWHHDGPPCRSRRRRSDDARVGSGCGTTHDAAHRGCDEQRGCSQLGRHPARTSSRATSGGGDARRRAVRWTIVTTLPPGCVTTVLNSVEYQRCGSTYDRAMMQGSNLVLVVQQP